MTVTTSGPLRPPQPGDTVGWDVGGAHLKACCVDRDGRVVDAAQWPCALWQGQDRLAAALQAAGARWPGLTAPGVAHAVTMSGEMVDLFPTRADGVRRLAAQLAEALGPRLRLWAGGADARWVPPEAAGPQAAALASANWRAAAVWMAGRLGDAVLVDVGSTTTDLIAVAGGRLLAHGGREADLARDADRLAAGTLVYQGVARTPLCALGPTVPFDGAEVAVMNEWFATTADVYRLTGELDEAHDPHPAADGGAKDVPGTHRRLARMIGRDAADAPPACWQALARAWRERQLRLIGDALARVTSLPDLPDDAPLVAAGCGEALVPELARRAGRAARRLCDLVPMATSDDPHEGVALARWVQVGVPAAAVALLAREG